MIYGMDAGFSVDRRCCKDEGFGYRYGAVAD